MSHVPTELEGVAAGQRYVGVAVIPRRRRPIEMALGRVVELGGEALLITADGSGHARYPGVEHIDLLSLEMHLGANRLIAVSPARVAGRLVGRKVRGRSLAWRVWVRSRPYKVGRFYLLWRALSSRLDVVRPADVTHVFLAGAESWPIAWQLAQLNPEIEVGWDIPVEWRVPAPPEVDEDEGDDAGVDVGTDDADDAEDGDEGTSDERPAMSEALAAPVAPETPEAFEGPEGPEGPEVHEPPTS